MKGPDHSPGLNPVEFINFIKSIRNAEKLLIKKKNKITSDEQKFQISKKIDSSKTRIKKGEKFSRKNITNKRPDNGISASKWFKVLNKVAKKILIKTS